MLMNKTIFVLLFSISALSLSAFADNSEKMLSDNIYTLNTDLLENLISDYQKKYQDRSPLLIFAQARLAFLQSDYDTAINLYRQLIAINPELNPVRIELAIALFYSKQYSSAKEQFDKAKSISDLPVDAEKLIDHYLERLVRYDSWIIDFSGNYVRETNINNVSNERQIEKTGYIKDQRMLPQKGHGFSYNIGLNRDYNLIGKHYLTINNILFGKHYWDNHQYDELINRLYIGYTYKTVSSTYKVKPFYEKRWYGTEKYRWSNGIRLEYSHRLNPNWQVESAIEFSKNYYYQNNEQNGNNKLLSNSLIWLTNPKQFFYLGLDFSLERTKEKQYSSNRKTLRLGWGQEWDRGVSSRLDLSFTNRVYKDMAKLGGFFPLNKIREDRIYHVNLQLWKRDWHLWNITPKLVYSWRKQVSNITTMYSYTDKNINLIFETTF